MKCATSDLVTLKTVKIHFTVQNHVENGLPLLYHHLSQELQTSSTIKLGQKYKYRMTLKHLICFFMYT